MLIMILVFFIPSIFLTGLIVPIDTSSPAMAILGGILPASHYVVLARGVFLKGLPLTEFARPLVILLSIGAATLMLSLALFKKRIS
jgi:ABC-2 type transport system permease protein